MLPRNIRAAVCVGAMMLAGSDAPCQTFDVATVRPNRTGKGGGDLAASPGMLTIRNLREFSAAMHKPQKSQPSAV